MRALGDYTRLKKKGKKKVKENIKSYPSLINKKNTSKQLSKI